MLMINGGKPCQFQKQVRRKFDATEPAVWDFFFLIQFTNA